MAAQDQPHENLIFPEEPRGRQPSLLTFTPFFPVLLAEIGIKERDRMEGFFNLYFFHFNTEVSYLYSI